MPSSAPAWCSTGFPGRAWAVGTADRDSSDSIYLHTSCTLLSFFSPKRTPRPCRSDTLATRLRPRHRGGRQSCSDLDRPVQPSDTTQAAAAAKKHKGGVERLMLSAPAPTWPGHETSTCYDAPRSERRLGTPWTSMACQRPEPMSVVFLRNGSCSRDSQEAAQLLAEAEALLRKGRAGDAVGISELFMISKSAGHPLPHALSVASYVRGDASSVCKPFTLRATSLEASKSSRSRAWSA